MIDDPELPHTGVVPLDDASARWCVWAPNAKRVELVLGLGDSARRLEMQPQPHGYHATSTARPETGQRYAYSLDGGPPLPDPASRWQPDGVDAPSAVWSPDGFAWDEGDWKGINRCDLVFYELHVGTFTSEGTFDAIVPRIPELLDLGITAIELMPVGQFAGERGWGYDGVLPFAVQHGYGGPEALRRFVQACHRQGMAVWLDVIYNHFGPEGSVLPKFGPYLTDKYKTDWGPAFNYDDRGCDAVRAIMLDHVRMCVRDFHVDGLRIDAADQIYDRGPKHILADIADVAHAEGERLGRPVHVFAETDLNDAPRFLHPAERGGYGFDGHWNDDFHHAAHVVLTGETRSFFVDFAAGSAALAKAYERVFVNEGNFSPFRGRRHGAPAGEFPGDRFLAFTQNHDQVGNRTKSDRYAASLSPACARLAAGILLLAPRVPLLFMGEEYGETNPFPFFCDFRTPELIEAVRRGRAGYFGFEGETLDPVAVSTRDAAVLSWTWNDPRRAGLRRLYRDLLRLRRESPTLRDFRHARTRLLEEGRVLEVRRGGIGPDPTPELRIYFNVTDDDQPLPADLASESPSFRSEVAGYGAEPPEADRRFTHLRPREFQVFGSLLGN